MAWCALSSRAQVCGNYAKASVVRVEKVEEDNWLARRHRQGESERAFLTISNVYLCEGAEYMRRKSLCQRRINTIPIEVAAPRLRYSPSMPPGPPDQPPGPIRPRAAPLCCFATYAWLCAMSRS